MTTYSLRSEISADGTLRLEVPCPLPPGPVDVVVVVQPSAERGDSISSGRPARSGLFVGRSASGDDVDSISAGIVSDWEAKLKDLAP